MGIETAGFETLPDVLRWLHAAPPGTRLDASAVAEVLESLAEEKGAPEPASSPPSGAEWSWRERLWTVPAETRLGTSELAEALGRPKSWVYARTQAGAEDPVPHRKLDGTLTFTAGEVRAWIRDREEVVAGGPMESTEAEKRLEVLEGGAT